MLDNIQAMRKQESSYLCKDYMFNPSSLGSSKTQVSSDDVSSKLVDQQCRVLMCHWSYQLIDQCSLHRETVAIAMSYIDRFLCTKEGRDILKSRRKYQLACVSCLFVAIKIHEDTAVSAKLLASISRGMHTAEQIEEMELKLLSGLDWRVHPPTSLSFVQKYMSLLALKKNQEEAVFELAKFQTEVAVQEYPFVTFRPSEIAFCAIMNALDAIGDSDIQNHLDDLLTKLSLDDDDFWNLDQLQRKLYHAAVDKVGDIPPDLETKAIWISFKTSEHYKIPSHVHLVSPEPMGSPRCVSQPSSDRK
jgi:hypothetical protein